jgi:hypothetical protein
MNPIEVQMLSRLSPTGQLTRNPATGQPEAFLPFLAPLLGSFLGSSLLPTVIPALAGKAALAGAIGSGLATTAVTGDLEQGIMSGITGFGIGSALGGLDKLATPVTEVAQAGTQAATQAAADTTTQLATQIPQVAEGFGSAINPVADIASQAAPSAVGDVFEGFGASMSPDAFSPAARIPPVEMTAGQRFAQPFQQPGQFISNLAKPESFLPVYVGETGRMARQQEIAGQGSARAYEEEQEAEKNRIRGQMSDVFNQVRSAYPGVGYAAGGMVERYAEGGFNIDQDLINSLRFSGLPAAENVQLSLRGSESVPPPASSYSALDVGGEGYLAGVAPEFQYFRAPPPPPPLPGGTPPGGGPDFNQPIMGPGYGGFLDEYLRNYGGGPGRGGMADDMSDFTSRPGREDMDMPVYTGGTPDFNEGGFDRSIIEELLNSQFNPIRDRLAAIESRPIPEFDYSRIPAYTQPDFSGIEERLANIESRPIPEFDYSRIPAYTPFDFSGIEERLASIESRPQPSFDYSRIPSYTPPDFSGIEERLAAIESRPMPEFEYDRIPQFDMSMIEDRLSGLETSVGSIGNRQIDFSPIEQRLAAIESRPMPEFDYSRIPSYTPFDFSGIEDRLANIESRPIPEFDYSRIPAYTPPDFSNIESQIAGLNTRFENLPAPQVNIPQFDLSPIQQQIADLQSGIGALQSRPQPSFDLSGLEQRLASIESRGTPQVSFDPIMERLSSLESLLASQRSAPSQNIPSFQNPFDEFSMTEGFAEGGMTGMDNQSQMGAENSIVEMTVAAIRGEIENADQIISRFVEMYGPEVFTQLRERVLQDIVPGAQTEGMVEGMGGGQDDLVEGMIGTQRPVAVSPGEYIIPADVVSLAGGGYSGNGASFFDGLVDDIRQKTMGTTKQVRPYQRSA